MFFRHDLGANFGKKIDICKVEYKNDVGVDSSPKCNYDCKVKKKVSRGVLNPHIFLVLRLTCMDTL